MMGLNRVGYRMLQCFHGASARTKMYFTIEQWCSMIYRSDDIAIQTLQYDYFIML